MTESSIREILRVVHQAGDGPMALKPSPLENRIEIVARQEPDGGVGEIRIPVKLVESLNAKQAFLIFRNLQNILKDIEEGKIYKELLETLFQHTAKICLVNSENGERLFDITGRLSEGRKRRYIERYAEHVATHILFDIAKALNARLDRYLAPDERGKYFLEGRDFSDRKVRYGEEVGTELLLSDEGAAAYTGLLQQNPALTETVAALLQQAMLDPFGLSIKHYMGKHNVMKAGKRPLVKMPPISGFFSWFKGLFRGKPKDGK